MKWRVFTNDVGPNQFSALKEIEAESWDEALRKMKPLAKQLRCKVLVAPENRRDLWPDGQTGRIPTEAKRYIVR